MADTCRDDPDEDFFRPGVIKTQVFDDEGCGFFADNSRFDVQHSYASLFYFGTSVQAFSSSAITAATSSCGTAA
jgi:hypothetical protein